MIVNKFSDDRQHVDLPPEKIVMGLALPITYNLISEIACAFDCEPVLEAFSVFNMSKVPDSMNAMREYGKVECLFMTCRHCLYNVD